MFRNVRYLTKCFQRAKQVNVHRFNPISLSFTTTAARPVGKPMPPIVDVDIEKMMYEDSELADNFNLPIKNSEGQVINSRDMDGAPLAPIDVNGWEEDEETKHGTTDMPKENKQFTYPPIPTERCNTFQFKGIKVMLPKKMLRPETYRFRLDQSDQEKLADDIRICKFEK